MSEKTKSTVKALIRVAVAMIIFVLAVINYDRLKNIDVRALVEGSSSVLVAVQYGAFISQNPFSLLYPPPLYIFQREWLFRRLRLHLSAL